MKFLSVCSGIEAASVAWAPRGWKASAFSEIEPFPCALLAHHYPDVPNLGDMTKFKDWPDDLSVDLLCGGTPCQSFSVAGLRAGLADPRGNLMLTYLAIAAKHRPKWVVWENVPGVLSSWSCDEPPSDLAEGQEWEAVETSDFGSFLAGLGELGYGYAYRILDAQYFGVPQRRRRVFVVGCLGDWHAAAAVLFERHSLQGHPSPRRQARKRSASTLSACPEGGGRLGTDFESDEDQVPRAFGGGNTAGAIEISTCLTHHGNRQDFDSETFIISSARVRRLTPLECERLQGFPDNYTLIGHRRNLASDSARYKALGNSWAVPCAKWIGERISSVTEIVGSHGEMKL